MISHFLDESYMFKRDCMDFCDSFMSHLLLMVRMGPDRKDTSYMSSRGKKGARLWYHTIRR